MRRNAGTDFAPGNLFTDGDPNSSIPASVVGSDWLNILQEEVAGLIEAAGLTLDQATAFPSNNTGQLLAAIQLLASAGGGGGGFQWTAVEGGAPIEQQENGEKVYLFEKAGSQSLCAYLKVPQGYNPGKQIKMYIAQYSPSAAGTMLLKTTATLIRQNVDAVTSTTNQYTATNTALTNTVANRYRQALCDITDSTGKINSVAVNPGDLIKVELFRDIASDTDTADVRLIPNATEVKFA